MDSATVKLCSGDGFSFIVAKHVAEQSPTIKNMLDTTRGAGDAAAFAEALTSEIRLPEIKGKVLEKVCQYLVYKHRYADADSADASVPEFKFDV
ncbi:Transcription elongation factor B (SIII), polypeptide 1 (15kDa, elongin C), partial [Coemansia sp. RSA 2399]